VIALVLVSMLAVAASAQVTEYSSLNNVSSNAVLAQPSSQSGSALLPRPEWMGNLTITGFLQNTTGAFLDTKALEYHHSKNSLIAERNLLQVDLNDNWGEHLSAFARFWTVYEPEYRFDKEANSGAENLDDFYNEYAFRDLWVKGVFGPFTLSAGKEIAEWGESIAFRVGDQINPQDLSYAFGFANLEQSHMPIWMLHPILNLPQAGPLGANFVEMVYAPGFDFLYNHVDYPDDHMEGQNDVAGRVDILPSAGARFAGRPEERCQFPESLCIPVPGSLPNGNLVIGPPVSYVLEGKQIPDVQWQVPRATFSNSVVGVRLHTLIASNVEASVFYLYNHEISPVLELGPPGKPGTFRRVNLTFPKYQSFGATFNMPAPLPPSIANAAPIIFRGEMFYKNHAAISTADPSQLTGVVHSDTVSFMLAADLDSASEPWLTSTGTLNANFEFLDNVTLSPNHNMLQAPGFLTRAHHNEISVLASVGTSWYWGAVAPNWTGIYNPDGNTLIMFPGVTFTPPWTPKYFGKIGYVGIFGQNKFAVDAGGLFKGMSYMYMQLQYNFNLL
jgi:hypothetical protein